jgi:hypothetical protein
VVVGGMQYKLVFADWLLADLVHLRQRRHSRCAGLLIRCRPLQHHACTR